MAMSGQSMKMTNQGMQNSQPPVGQGMSHPSHVKKLSEGGGKQVIAQSSKAGLNAHKLPNSSGGN